MSYKEFLLKMDANYPCSLVTRRNKESVCGHEDAMDLVTFSDNCRGNLTDRPEWCPLKESKFKGTYNTATGWEG